MVAQQRSLRLIVDTRTKQQPPLICRDEGCQVLVPLHLCSSPRLCSHLTKASEQALLLDCRCPRTLDNLLHNRPQLIAATTGRRHQCQHDLALPQRDGDIVSTTLASNEQSLRRNQPLQESCRHGPGAWPTRDCKGCGSCPFTHMHVKRRMNRCAKQRG